MGNPQAVHLKARAVLRQLGHSESEVQLEYKDWHIDIRGGISYISIWWSGAMVFLSISHVPVYYVPGPWEEHLTRLFHRTER